MSDFTAGVLVGVVGAILAAVLTGHFSRIHYQRAAIEHGAAEYVMDPKTGETTWHWKDEKK